MKKPKSLQFESLEPRHTMASDITAVLVNGVLTISGNNDDNQITVERSGKYLQVAQAKARFNEKNVTEIEIDLGEGNDSVRFVGPKRSWKSIGKETTIDAGEGNDVFTGPNGKKLYIGGEDSELLVTAEGVITVGSNAPDWFNENVSVSWLREQTREDLDDNKLDRADMLEIFEAFTTNDTVGKETFNSLKAIVDNDNYFVGVDYVQILSSYIVDGTVANKFYRKEKLGNLRASSTGDHLQLLVNKWFLGMDRPHVDDGLAGAHLEYMQVSGNLFDQDDIPKYEDMHQGADGDCFYLSSLMAIVFKNPELIVNMFIVNGDNTWTVRFYDKGKPVYETIDDQLPVSTDQRTYRQLMNADQYQLYNDPANILWAPFAEKAYAQVAEFGFLGIGDGKANAYRSINGGYPNKPLAQLLGSEPISMTRMKENAAGAIIAAFDQGRPVTFVTLDSPLQPAIVGEHVYSMMDYDVDRQVIKLFNPWGMHNGTAPGIVEVEFTKLVANFYSWCAGTVIV